MANTPPPSSPPRTGRRLPVAPALLFALGAAPLLAGCTEAGAPADPLGAPAAPDGALDPRLRERMPLLRGAVPGSDPLSKLAVSQERGITAPVAGAAFGLKAETAVAFGGTQHLVTWTDYRDMYGPWAAAFEPMVYAARVALDGTVLDAHGIAIGRGRAPAVSFDGANYLVVRFGDESCAVCGVRVGLDGAVLDVPGFPIGTGETFLEPAVAFDGENHVAVWACGIHPEHPGGAPNVCQARITPAGAVLDPGAVVTSLVVERGLSIASNGAGSLVAGWTEQGIQGVRVDTQGAVLDPAPIPIGPPMEFDIWADDATLAFDGDNYVAVWSDQDYPDDYALYAARVTPSGSVLDPSGILVVPLDPLSFFDPYSGVAAAANGAGTSIFFVQLAGEETYQRLYEMRLGQDGAVLDPAPIPVSASATAAYAAVAPSSAGAFVAWTDKRDEPADFGRHPAVLGARVSQAGPLLDPAGLLISTGVNEQTSPTVASDGQRYFVVWVDGRGEGNTLHGVRISPTGEELDPAGIHVAPDKGWHSTPRVVFDGEGFLVLWYFKGYLHSKGDSTFEVRATRVSPDGDVLAPASIPLGLCTWGDAAPVAAASNGASSLVVTAHCSDVDEPPRLTGALVGHTGAVVPRELGVTCQQACAPTLSADGTGYLLAWADGAEIRAIRLGSEGAVLDESPFTLASMPEPSCLTPVSAFNGQSHVVVWASADALLAVRVSRDGVVLDAQPIVLGPAPDADRCGRAAAAVDTHGERTVVAWGVLAGLDSPTWIDLQGVELGPDGTVLSSFTLSGEPGTDAWPGLASTGQGPMLAVYARFDSDASMRATRAHARFLTCDGPCAGEGGGGGSGGSGGSDGSGGGGGEGGTVGIEDPPGSTRISDCGCRVAGDVPGGAATPLAGLALGALFAARRRERARRAGASSP